MHILDSKWQNTTSPNLISHSMYKKQLIELITPINSKQMCWLVHASIIWPNSLSCHDLWESCHAPLNMSNRRIYACFHVDRAINNIYVNRGVIVFQQRVDRAEAEETCQGCAMAGDSERRRPQPDIWSPFQAPTAAHNRSLLFIFETLVMSLLLLSPQDNGCLKTRQHTPTHPLPPPPQNYIQ